MQVDRKGDLCGSGPAGFGSSRATGKHLSAIQPAETPGELRLEQGLYFTGRTGLHRSQRNIADIRP